MAKKISGCFQERLNLDLVFSIFYSLRTLHPDEQLSLNCWPWPPPSSKESPIISVSWIKILRLSKAGANLETSADGLKRGRHRVDRILDQSILKLIEFLTRRKSSWSNSNLFKAFTQRLIECTITFKTKPTYITRFDGFTFILLPNCNSFA